MGGTTTEDNSGGNATGTATTTTTASATTTTEVSPPAPLGDPTTTTTSTTTQCTVSPTVTTTTKSNDDDVTAQLISDLLDHQAESVQQTSASPIPDKLAMAAAAERLHPAERENAKLAAEAGVLVKSKNVASVSGIGAIPVKNDQAGPTNSPAVLSPSPNTNTNTTSSSSLSLEKQQLNVVNANTNTTTNSNTDSNSFQPGLPQPLPSDGQQDGQQQPQQQANPGAIAIAGIDSAQSVGPDRSLAFGYAPEEIAQDATDDNAPLFEQAESGEVMAQAITRDDLEEEVQRRIIAQAAVGQVVVQANDVEGGGGDGMSQPNGVDKNAKTPEESLKEKATIGVIVLVATVVLIVVLVVFVGLKQDQQNANDQAAAPPVDTVALLSLLETETLQLFETDSSTSSVQRLELSLVDSPQHKAFEWLAEHLQEFPLNDNDDETTLDQLLETYALATLFYATGGNKTWDLQSTELASSWMVGTDVCLWLLHLPQDVCNDQGRLERLHLPNVNMTRQLPLELLFLTELQQLNLADNRLEGPLPGAQLPSSLQQLVLDGNEFTGSDAIPTEDWNRQLTHLQLLSLRDNALLTATLPDDIFFAQNSLHTLHLDDSPLRGTIPTSWGTHLTRLQTFTAARVELSGTIPSEIGLWQSLQTFSIPQSNKLDTNLTGALPPEFWTISTLQSINLNYIGLSFTIPNNLLKALGPSLTSLNVGTTRLQGTLPTELGFLTNLEILELDNSAILGGTIPSELGLLTRLRILDLSRDPNLQGSLPTEVGWLTQLQQLWLYSSVSLTGSLLPSEIGQCTKLQSINLKGSTTVSSGPIPTEIGLLTELTELELLRTNMTGPIPSEIGLLQHFEILTLGGKGITGTLPTELGQASSMTKLLLAGTSVGGTIPPEYGNLVNMDKLAIDRNELTGTLPVTLAGMNKIDALSVNGNRLTGEFPVVYKDWHQVTRIMIQDNNFTGSIGRYTCGGWGEEYVLQADCDEVECDDCCTHCCRDGECAARDPENDKLTRPGSGRPTGPQFFPPIRG